MRSCPLKWLLLTDNSVSVQVDLCTFLLPVLMIPYTCLRQPLLRSWRNANVACASSSAFVRLSSPFHENSLVTQHTSAGLFHHRKTARGADPRSSSETCVMCEVVLLACWNWCSGFSFSGIFRSLQTCLSCTLGFFHLVSNWKPTENYPLARVSGGTLPFQTQSLLCSYSLTRIAVSGQSQIQLRRWHIGHWTAVGCCVSRSRQFVL